MNKICFVDLLFQVLLRNVGGMEFNVDGELAGLQNSTRFTRV